MAREKLQDECPQLNSRVEFALHLFFTRAHSLLYSHLSFNICREVFSYIDLDQFYLRTIKDFDLVAFNLANDSVQVTEISKCLDMSGAGLAMLNYNSMLVVGGQDHRRSAHSLNIWTGEVSVEASMKTGRVWPGILVYKECVWVFGGSNEWKIIRTVERFHRLNRSWKYGRSMLSPKSCFTPCEHRDLIYLPETASLLEVLNPATEVYSRLPLKLKGLPFSVSFIVNNTLYVIFHSTSKVGTWALGSQDEQLTDLKIFTTGAKFGKINGSPMKWGRAVYWVNKYADLVKFDLKALTLAVWKRVDLSEESNLSEDSNLSDISDLSSD